ncbi:MAG TPA: hypothetical protein VLC09_07460 [Polyangiaceae bacterium]|nr:hypothetical protein [Polyangiaceae bacterium]
MTRMAGRDVEALERLDDYVRGSLDEAHAGAFEEDLFERALLGAAPELSFRHGLGATLQVMKARGTLDLWLTAEGVQRLVQSSGLRVVVWEYGAPEGPPLQADTELLVTRIPFELHGIRRLEADVCATDGRLLKTMPDVIFDPEDGAVFACCEAELARTANAAVTITRVYAIDEAVDDGAVDGAGIDEAVTGAGQARRRHLFDMPSFG